MRVLFCFFACALSSVVHASATELGIAGSQFTINGKPVFLYGMSYYGGLGAKEEFVQSDLDDLQRLGFNWMSRESWHGHPAWTFCE